MAVEPDRAVHENTKIELAKALSAVKSVVRPSEYLKVRSLLVEPGTGEDIDNAIRGLSKEDEFALLCRLMGTATHLVHLEQRPVIRGESAVPDFLVRFQPGYTHHRKTSADSNGFRCLVEVKSTIKSEFKIGGKKLSRLRAFADQFGLPLIFAVRFLQFEENSVWVMEEDEDRTATSLRITLNSLAEGVRRVLRDDFMFMVFPDIRLLAVYDTTASNHDAIHAEYGSIRELRILAPGEGESNGRTQAKTLATFTGIDALTVMAFFEVFRPQDELVSRNGSATCVLMCPTVPCSVADAVFILNRLAREPDGSIVFDPSRILTGADRETTIFTRDFVEGLAQSLPDRVLGVVTFGEDNSHMSKWLAYGGKA